MSSDLENARTILQATRTLRFGEHASTDLRDRLGLVTVVAGLREVAAFGFAEHFNESRLRAIKDSLGTYGLPTQITRQVRGKRYSEVPTELASVFDRIDEESYESDPGRILWVCRNPRTREQIKRAVAGEIAAGTLLGYPKCCVEQNRDDNRVHADAFCRAIISAAKNDPAALERALREDLEVELTFDSPLGCDMEATEERFPFVQHIACGACLSSEDSPSARLNLKYEQVAREVARDFHTALAQMANVSTSIGRIIDDAESKGLSKETLDSETNRRLQDLFQEQNRILANFLRD